MPQCQDCKYHADGFCKAHPPTVTGWSHDAAFPRVEGTQEACGEFKADDEQ